MRRVPLRNRQGEVVAESIVDDEDFDWISGYRWHLAQGYAQTNIRTQTLNVRPSRSGWYRPAKLHRMLMNAEPGAAFDHINGDRLDNRRANLRPVLPWQSCANRGTFKSNTSGQKGVSWHRTARKWLVRISARGVRHVVGFYPSVEEARAAYLAAAENIHGEFART